MAHVHGMAPCRETFRGSLRCWTGRLGSKHDPAYVPLVRHSLHAPQQWREAAAGFAHHAAAVPWVQPCARGRGVTTNGVMLGDSSCGACG